jgi:hypothetical protein
VTFGSLTSPIGLLNPLKIQIPHPMSQVFTTPFKRGDRTLFRAREKGTDLFIDLAVCFWPITAKSRPSSEDKSILFVFAVERT